jgi:hypothetical protein
MVDQKYKPQRDAHGQLIPDPTGAYHEMEDHTLTMWVHRKLRRLEFRDSFYRHVYRFGSGEVNLEAAELRVFQKPDPKHRGKMVPALGLVIRAPDVEWKDTETGSDKSVGVRILPTVYAGTRDVPSNEVGVPRALGQVINRFSLVDLLNQERREGVKKFHEALLDHPTAKAYLQKKQSGEK